MKNALYILLIAVLAIGACKKDKPFDQEAQFGRDTVIIKKFIADNNIPAVKDASGLYYQIIAPGTGDVKPNDNSLITIKYKGRLLNGEVFDQNESIEFRLGGLIAGWRIGIPKIRAGGKIRLLIPSGYAYGNRPAGKIPANSVLDFDIELKEVK